MTIMTDRTKICKRYKLLHMRNYRIAESSVSIYHMMSEKHTSKKMKTGNEEIKGLRETVILILKPERCKVDKQKLINKSLYFAALLSSNYLEYRQEEHIINYNIPPISLQDFIDWIHNDKIDIPTNYDVDEINRLLILLELSILFAADDLVEDVSDRLVRHYMLPQYAIDIWLLALELNINQLRDLSLAVCLDRFDELPLSLILEVPRKDFLQLMGNINLRSTESNLVQVTYKWMRHNQDFTIPLDIVKNKEPKVIYSIISCEGRDVANSEQFIHCWDGKDFYELTSFKYPKDIVECSVGKKTLIGMQITANEYNLYLCGGEFGIGTNRFNKNVWRYSLVAKKWYLETVMPAERRHMITVFLKNKLVLVGGVGRYRQKMQTVDIYDIRAGLWTPGAKISFEFTTVPEHYVFDDKLIIHTYRTDLAERLTIWIYFPEENVWDTKMGFDRYQKLDSSQNIPILTLKTLPCYIDIDKPDNMILRIIKENCTMETKYNYLIEDHNNIEFGTKNDPVRSLSLHTNCEAHFLIATYWVFHDKRIVILLCLDPNTWKRTVNYVPLHLHSIPIRNPNKFRSLLFSHSSNRFLNLMHPDHLHTTNLDQFDLIQ